MWVAQNCSWKVLDARFQNETAILLCNSSPPVIHLPLRATKKKKSEGTDGQLQKAKSNKSVANLATHPGTVISESMGKRPLSASPCLTVGAQPPFPHLPLSFKRPVARGAFGSPVS
mmetsp:Transcript_139454/g.242549  ORF Transcript_139454/g.242549 Transcript_139454/m.242549 type:complete len:116 (-) Transcript_139454:68-415(-)